MASRQSSTRRRIGRVSLYLHHGAFWTYHTEGGRAVRRLVGESAALAECEASLLNARLVSAEAGIALATVPAADSIAALLMTGSAAAASADRSAVTVSELRSKFVAHHEGVLGSSLATVSRYRSATLYLERFASDEKLDEPMRIAVPAFIEHLRKIEVSPNGHVRSAKRRLRSKGIRYILECCRSMYRFGQRQGHLHKGASNPFSEIGLEKFKIRDAKPIFVFTPEQELAFLTAADAWSFAVHFTLANSGMRRGELVHSLIEDVDLEKGWWEIRSKPELGWTTKTNHDRRLPLIAELVTLLRCVIGERKHGPVFIRPKLDRLVPVLTGNRSSLAKAVDQRTTQERERLERPLSRPEEAKIHQSVWHDAGAVDADQIRTSFIRIARAAGLTGATCVKSWRHTFATLLQQANVDVLVRQQTLGHQIGNSDSSALGMTGVYTHTTPEFQRREIERALRVRSECLELIQPFVAKSKVNPATPVAKP